MRGVQRLLATLVTAAALATAWLAAAAPAAHAEDPVALVSITLNAITPSLPKRDGTISLSGRVTNTSDKRLFRLQAIFWRNQAPITDADGIKGALDSAANDPLGRRFFKRFSADGYQDLYEPRDPYLEPGKSKKFTVTVKVSDLELSPTDGVYLMGVHVLQNGNQFAVGRARVFVPVLDAAPKNSLKMTSVVVLNSRPSLVSKGVLADDHLAAELRPGGRLHSLLRAVDADQMTYAVDPELIEEVQTMAAGYQVTDGDGASRRGVGQTVAAQWLNDFQLQSGRDGFRLLYGSPDVAALVHSRQTALLTRAENAAKTVNLTASLPLLVLPGGGMADAATVAAAEDLRPAAIVLSDESAKGSGPLLQGPGVAPLVTYSEEAFAGGPGPKPSDTPVHLQQRMLADSWIEASSADADSTLGRVRLITDAAQARGDDANVKTPWMKRTTLSDLLRSKPDAWNQKFHYPDRSASAELTAEQLGDVRRLGRSYATYAELLVQPDALANASDAVLARSTSVWWRGLTAESQAYTAAPQRELDTILRDGLSLSGSRRVTTTSNLGFFPITIRNLLSASTDPGAADNHHAVRVRLEFTSTNRQRLSAKPLVPPEPIAAGAAFTGNAQVEARTNGTVQVVAQLVTLSGTKVGRPITIDVNATQAGRTGWLIAIAAGLVLIGSTALRIRQVAKERAKTDPEPPPASALTSAPPEPDDVSSPERLDG